MGNVLQGSGDQLSLLSLQLWRRRKSRGLETGGTKLQYYRGQAFGCLGGSLCSKLLVGIRNRPWPGALSFPSFLSFFFFLFFWY